MELIHLLVRVRNHDSQVSRNDTSCSELLFTLMNEPCEIITGADPGFEKGGFNVVPKSDTEAPLTIIYENTTRRELKIIIS